MLALLSSPVEAHEGPAPTKPTGLSAEAYHNHVILTWDDPSDESVDDYEILRRNHDTDAQGQFTTLVENTGTPETTYTDIKVGAQTHYAYRVKAINEHGTSEASISAQGHTPAATKPTAERSAATVRHPSNRDFWFTTDNGDPTGIWCGDQTMYVADDNDLRVYAYNVLGGAHQSTLGFALESEQTHPRGAFANADTMWVADRDGRIFAYTISVGSSYGNRDTTKEFLAQTDNGYLAGIHSITAKDMFFAVDIVDEQLYTYNTDEDSGSLGDRVESADFDLIPDYAKPRSLWSNEADTIWVLDAERKRVFAYEIGPSGASSGTRLPAREIALDPLNANPWGICSDGDVMWVADQVEKRVYAYDLPPVPSGDITGITFDEIEEQQAKITVEIENPDSASKSVKLSYGLEPDGPTTTTDAKTTTGTEVSFTLTGLTAGKAYRLSAIMGTETLTTSGFRTWSKSYTLRKHLKLSVVPRFREDYPWIREVYREMRRVHTPVQARSGYLGSLFNSCDDAVGDAYIPHQNNGLHECEITKLIIGNDYVENTEFVIHELGHVGTIGTNFMAEDSESVGMGWLYYQDLENGSDDNTCAPAELFADAIQEVFLSNSDTAYYHLCPETSSRPSETALSVARSALQGEVPEWLGDEYGATGLAYDTSDDPMYDQMYDLEEIWRDVKMLSSSKADRESAIYAFRHAFGGYCDRVIAHFSGMHEDRGVAIGMSRNPWKAGGCVPQAVEAPVVTGTSLSWNKPAYDGGLSLTRYEVEWKSGDQEFHSSRKATIYDLTNLTYQNDAFGPGTTIRISASNIHGRGEYAMPCILNPGDLLVRGGHGREVPGERIGRRLRVRTRSRPPERQQRGPVVHRRIHHPLHRPPHRRHCVVHRECVHKPGRRRRSPVPSRA